MATAYPTRFDHTNGFPPFHTMTDEAVRAWLAAAMADFRHRTNAVQRAIGCANRTLRARA
jgi:hypothetical protein